MPIHPWKTKTLRHPDLGLDRVEHWSNTNDGPSPPWVSTHATAGPDVVSRVTHRRPGTTLTGRRVESGSHDGSKVLFGLSRPTTSGDYLLDSDHGYRILILR